MKLLIILAANAQSWLMLGFCSQSILGPAHFVLGIVLIHAQGWPCRTSWGSQWSSSQAPQDPSEWHPFSLVNHTTLLSVIRQLAENVLKPTVHATDNKVKQQQFHYQPLRNVTHHWSPPGQWGSDHNSLSTSTQFLIYEVVYPSNLCLSTLKTRFSCWTVSNISHKSR